MKAARPEETNLLLRAGFVARYLDDDAFRRALVALADAHGATLANIPNAIYRWPELVAQEKQKASHTTSEINWQSQYVQAIRTFVADWGLTFDDHEAEGAVHSWCTRRREVGEKLQPKWLISEFSAGGAVAEVGEIVSREEFLIKNSIGESVRVVDERREPRVRITIEDTWYADRESRTNFTKRLGEKFNLQLQSEIERIKKAYKEGGWAFSKRPHAINDHLEWLFLYQAKQKSFIEIAVKVLGTGRQRQSVEEGVKTLAEKMGLELRAKKPGKNPEK